MKEPKKTRGLAWPRSKIGPANMVVQQVKKAWIDPIHATALFEEPGMSVDV